MRCLPLAICGPEPTGPLMLSLFRKPKPAGDIPALYAAIVAQSRQPVFFARMGVPDTMTGRFDMVSAHMGLVLRRLRREGEDTAVFAQALFDHFFADMDRTLREVGVGDLSVAKRIAKMGELFYGLLAVLTPALDAGDRAAVREILSRNLLDGGEGEGLDALTDYVLDSGRQLDGQSVAAIRDGLVTFGTPA